MKLSSWKFYWSEAAQNIGRNLVLALASVTSAAVSLLVFGLFIALSMNVAQVAQVMEGQVGIEAFLSDSVTGQGIQTMEAEIRAWPDVRSVTFVSKGAALRTLERDFGSEGKAFNPLGKDNPLMNAFYVKAKTPPAVAAIAARLAHLSGVRQVNYQAPVVSRLFRLIDLLRLAGLGVGVLLALGTLLIIQNAIRLGIFARRREIQIMRLVGATEGFIHWPFLLEGMLLGVVGGVVAAGVIAGLYHVYIGAVHTALPFLPAVAEGHVDRLLLPAIVAVGLLIGFLGSQFSIRRVRV